MDKKLLSNVKKAYGKRGIKLDLVEFFYKKVKEKLFGVNKSIFRDTIQYFEENEGKTYTISECIQNATSREKHKKAWNNKARETIVDKMHFYQEVNTYLFVQPYVKRFGGYRWYRHIVKHFSHPSILEYGCGSAIVTEYLLKKYPDVKYTVADIPSSTMDFIKWKKSSHGYPYAILTIGEGDAGIPLKSNYDLIICQDVLEHTPNPLGIVKSFVEHLSENGVLVIDFLDASAGNSENLIEAIEQREDVKSFLSKSLHPIKEIDKPFGNNGIYIKFRKINNR